MRVNSRGVFLTESGRNRLKEEIERSSLSREEIAEKIGVGYSQLTYYTTNKKSQRPIMPDILHKLAAVLGVTEEYLLGESNYRTAIEAKAAEIHRAADIGFITESPIFGLLQRAGYELSGVYWQPYSIFKPEELVMHRLADHAQAIANALEEIACGGGEPDRGPVYEFRTRKGRRVYVPAENFAAAEQLLEDFARATFRNLFENWIGREAIEEAPPEEWRLPDPE